MMLVFEGNANVVAKSKVKNKKLLKDYVEGETPLHEAKTGKILRILLSKTTPQQLMAIDKFAITFLINAFLGSWVIIELFF